MPKVGGMGLDMMYRTCTVQANLDFASEADMVAKFRTSLALQPIATALFANSPFIEGKPSGFLSSRANVWTDTDPDRTGMLDFVFEDGFGYEAYARYALDVPMYFAKRDGRYVDLSGRSFRKFMAGELEELPGARPTLKDWADHTTTIFPEVRLKQYLEMRGADSGPWGALCALPALWTGVLYDGAALEAAWDLCKDWSADEHNALRADVARRGLKAEVGGRTVQAVAKDMLAIARAGLKGRNRLSGGLVDETGYLAELDEIADSGVTRAERMLELYHGPWKGDAGRAFDDLVRLLPLRRGALPGGGRDRGADPLRLLALPPQGGDDGQGPGERPDHPGGRGRADPLPVEPSDRPALLLPPLRHLHLPPQAGGPVELRGECRLPGGLRRFGVPVSRGGRGRHDREGEGRASGVERAARLT
jgi:hypothetical protein